MEAEWSKGVLMQVKKADEQGIDLRPYAEKGYGSNVLKQIRRAKLTNVDLDFYVNSGCDGEQLREIRIAIKYGIFLQPYLKEGFCGAQLRQIRKGLRHFIDVDVYAKECYNWLQMKELRIGLQNRVDVSLYSNPLYSHSQMKEIRLGLEEGVDVSSYASLIYSRMDMEQKRRELTGQLYEDEIVRKDSTIVDEGTGLEILVTENRMKAYITFPAVHRKLHFTVDYVEQILKRNGIVYGIIHENIASAIEEKRFDENILVAQGKEPSVGAEGRYEFLFNTEPSRKPAEMEDGRVDYKDVDIFVEVMENQPIARYIFPEKGEPGISVNGVEIPGKKGRELPVLQGEGFHLREDGVTYAATVSGMIEYKNDEIHIYEALIINEDVNASYGNINYHGCIHIYGNVGSNVEINAVGSISVEGTVEAAYIYSQGDVLLKNGMAGAGKGIINAVGNIAGNFFESASLHAGNNIEAGYLLNSESEAGEKVIMMGRRGSIIGGKTKSIHGIEANNIGNRSQIITEVETGANLEVQGKLQKCQEKYEKVQMELMEVTNQIGRFISNEDKQSVAYRKLVNEHLKLRDKAEKLINERKYIQEVLMTKSVINVMSRAYAGTRITINQVTMQLEEDHKMTTFCIENQQIVRK